MKHARTFAERDAMDAADDLALGNAKADGWSFVGTTNVLSHATLGTETERRVIDRYHRADATRNARSVLYPV